MEFNIWTALFLFVTYFFFDILYSWFILSVQNLKAALSSIISGSMYVISAIGVIKYTENAFYLLPVALGASLGTYFFIKHEKKKEATKAKNHSSKK